MPAAAHSHRPRAAGRVNGPSLLPVLALLAGLGLLASPAAALGHHHGTNLSPDGDGACPVCLWQAHHSADLVAAPGAGVLPTARLAAAAAPCRPSGAILARPTARAPPAASV